MTSHLDPKAKALFKELSFGLKELLKKSPPLLASSEEAGYFREWAKGKKRAPLPAAAPLALPSIEKPIEKQVEKPVEKQAEKPVVKEIEVKPLPPRAAPKTFSEVRLLFEKIAPHLPLMERPPSDEQARKMATLWKTKNQTAPLSILSYQEPTDQRLFLEQIAHALDLYFGPAKLIPAEPIEKEKRWDAFLAAPGLKVVIACDYTLWQLNALRSFYKENVSEQGRTLGKIPLFLLPDLSLYLKDPLLKRSLWKALCQKLSS